tara:strand:+ start:643 stop:2013 length:1371 start_codon:yes stop_codon:yes gene_type:complete
MSEVKIEKLDFNYPVGGERLVKNASRDFDRTDYMLKNMEFNKAYIYKKSKNLNPETSSKILEEFKKRYIDYRKGWVNASNNYIAQDNFEEHVKHLSNPLSIDIETAAICDLACPQCSREYVITPDKLMTFDFYKKIINEVSQLNIPSIKLNWRGEPLLNPRIHELVDYAKQKGILEVSINTNAVTLDEKKSKQLIESGLDVILFSFDGGSKETYEKFRPGRFNKNKFENVYKNIKNFYRIREEMGSKFPISKIQMILTKETRTETDNFFKLFDNVVDDVTVIPYSERGGNVDDLTNDQEERLSKYLSNNNLSKDTPYLVNMEGDIYVSRKRKPCEQLFQRLMITYDGRVGMCCHDWGAQHGIGFLNKQAFNNNKIISDIEKKIKDKKKGFELLNKANRPKNFNEPPHKLENIKEIWTGNELNKVRRSHFNHKVDEVAVCKECSFKDTYSWEKIRNA